jgi:hypothetical protein
MTLMTAWNDLFDLARPAFAQQRTFQRARSLALSGLACLGRHTVSGLLCAGGQQFLDWSAAYRLFEQRRIHLPTLSQVCLRATLEAIPLPSPVVALMDDTLVSKRGTRISGTSWRRDPLGPKFRANFLWASRFLQVSLALPACPTAALGPARAVPVDLQHAPSPRKPKPQAGPEAWRAWRRVSTAAAISRLGLFRIQKLRQAIDELPFGQQRSLLCCVDATYTNYTVLRDLPARTCLIGRVRKDARLFALPSGEPAQGGRGRRRVYGRPQPTPEQYLQNAAVPWQPVCAFAAGQVYTFDVKYLAPLLWRQGARSRCLALLVIRPFPYRLRQQASRCYRQPAYLICTDLGLTPQQILQTYLWRWEIEVNFRDQKTLLGLGEPQVRTEAAICTAAAFSAFSYVLLLLALDRCRLIHSPLPRPRWQRSHRHRRHARITTPQSISLLRAELWAGALGLPNKSGFATLDPGSAKPLKTFFSLKSAVLYATG